MVKGVIDSIIFLEIPKLLNLLILSSLKRVISVENLKVREITVEEE